MTLSVNSEDGQKQLASLLESHLGSRLSQVLIHLGTTLGHGAEGTDEGVVVTEGTSLVSLAVTGDWPVGRVVLPAVQRVQTVAVEVRVTVETVL
jgi:hypothetical protein